MADLIQDRKEKKELRYDLFSSLLDANDDQDISEGNVKLTTRELFGELSQYLIDAYHAEWPGTLGNIFIFQLAGHEVGGATCVPHFH